MALAYVPTLYKARNLPLKRPVCAICVDRTRGRARGAPSRRGGRGGWGSGRRAAGRGGGAGARCSAGPPGGGGPRPRRESGGADDRAAAVELAQELGQLALQVVRRAYGVAGLPLSARLGHPHAVHQVLDVAFVKHRLSTSAFDAAGGIPCLRYIAGGRGIVP